MYPSLEELFAQIPPSNESPAEARERLVNQHPEPISRLEALELAYAYLEASDRPEGLKAADVIAQMIDEYPDEGDLPSS